MALNRIATYLEEEEVDEQVSTLKRTTESPASSDVATAAYGEITSGLGILDGSFKWNEVQEREGAKDSSKKTNGVHSEDTDTIVGSSSASFLEGEGQDHRFELRDINVMFPEGELTVVTGPTASGKTALLVCLDSSPVCCY